VQRREGAPGAAASIYNRSLYQPEAAAPPRANPGAPPQPRPAAQPAAPAPNPQQPGQQKKPEEPRHDRFSLIELE